MQSFPPPHSILGDAWSPELQLKVQPGNHTHVFAFLLWLLLKRLASERGTVSRQRLDIYCPHEWWCNLYLRESAHKDERRWSVTYFAKHWHWPSTSPSTLGHGYTPQDATPISCEVKNSCVTRIERSRVSCNILQDSLADSTNTIF
jgi:hypothetical protein